METLVSDQAHPLTVLQASLGSLDADDAAKLIAAAGDLALIIDGEGVIRDVSFGGDDLASEGCANWLGRKWIDTVTVESRPKVEELLRDAAAMRSPRPRQVNHASPSGVDLPVRYSVVQVGAKGQVVAIGRDLRALAALQQRLVEAQLSMEVKYSRLRHAETRYRLLFHIASEAVLIVDAANDKVVEANPAAGERLGKAAGGIVGKSLFELISADSAPAVRNLLATVRASGRAADVPARLHDQSEQFLLSASMFRQEKASHFLVRFSPSVADSVEPGARKPDSKLLKVVGDLPEGFVVTNLDRRILTANAAFLDLAQLASEEHARGEPLDRWLGRPGIDLNVLAANLREHGAVRQFATILRGEWGSTEEVELSAVAVLNGEEPCFGFMVRSAGRRPITEPRLGRVLPRSAEQLTELIGRVPLKDLVRETTDVIERLCIETALELTGDNRASAAQLLGLSRQSLYVKLRRFGLDDGTLDAGD